MLKRYICLTITILLFNTITASEKAEIQANLAQAVEIAFRQNPEAMADAAGYTGKKRMAILLFYKNIQQVETTPHFTVDGAMLAAMIDSGLTKEFQESKIMFNKYYQEMDNLTQKAVSEHANTIRVMNGYNSSKARYSALLSRFDNSQDMVEQILFEDALLASRGETLDMSAFKEFYGINF